MRQERTHPGPVDAREEVGGDAKNGCVGETQPGSDEDVTTKGRDAARAARLRPGRDAADHQLARANDATDQTGNGVGVVEWGAAERADDGGGEPDAAAREGRAGGTPVGQRQVEGSGGGDAPTRKSSSSVTLPKRADTPPPTARVEMPTPGRRANRGGGNARSSGPGMALQFFIRLFVRGDTGSEARARGAGNVCHLQTQTRQGRCNLLRVLNMIFLLNRGLDWPPPRLATLAKHVLIAPALWNTNAGCLQLSWAHLF